MEAFIEVSLPRDVREYFEAMNGMPEGATTQEKFGSMATTREFSTYVLEQLRLLPGVTSRRMFGGLGLYSDGLFFALLADDTLYCKVDDSNRADYLECGMSPFVPFPGKPGMSYYEVPLDVLEDAEELARWARKSVAVALAAASRKMQPTTGCKQNRSKAPETRRRTTLSKKRRR